jgi:hypothetical protein
MAKKTAKKTRKKKKALPQKKYRVTIICGDVGGPVTAENVGLKFSCPSCKAKIEVAKDFRDLKVGNENPPGHQLRSVRER